MTADELAELLLELMGSRPVAQRNTAGGYSEAKSQIFVLEDGRSCFVKTSSGTRAAAQLRSEFDRVYSRIQAPFLPQVLAWWDDGSTPVLVIEDLSDAYWPPPWSVPQIDAVVSTLSSIRRTKIDGLPRLQDSALCQNWWTRVEGNPLDFLRLGLVSSEWLQWALPALSSASSEAFFMGEDLVHLDVRSDNLCFLGDRVILIDWSSPCSGNGMVDLASWLPSLRAEGGPLPETILPDAAEFAAWMSGYWAWQAAQPAIPEAPRVREIQLIQLSHALPWAARSLGLPELDGPARAGA